MDQLLANLGLLMPYVAAGLIGSLVGAAELIGRYRDEPFRAIRSRPGTFYMGVNGAASIVVLAAAEVFGWTFGASATGNQAKLLQIVVSGFGAMAVLRTSLFSVRVAETEIGIGPVALLQVLLVAIDRGVDRRRAADRATATGRIMTGLSFDEVAEALPTYSIALMQNLSPEDQGRLGQQVGELVGSKMDERLKVLILGLLVMNAVGEEVLGAAVDSIRREINQVPVTARRRMFFEGPVETPRPETSSGTGPAPEPAPVADPP